MKADHGATPIPIPSIVDDPRWIGRFSREVRKSIAALRDRKVIVRGRQGRGGSGGDGPTGAFVKLYVDGGDTYLQCGSVTGGNGGSASIADYKVVDGTTGAVAADGQILYVQANCTATVADGVMLPGCVLNSATTGTGSTVPPNHSFTTTALTGDIYLEIGRWADGKFLPAGPAGNLYADGCIGSFSVTRI